MKKLQKLFKIKLKWPDNRKLKRLFKAPVDLTNQRHMVMIIVTASIVIYILLVISLFKFPIV